jgi:putative DNA methylase
MTATRRLIETDAYPFEFISQVAERESWRKEIHRPIYHLHKWWAKRLGSVFRGVVLGAHLDEHTDLRQSFYETHDFSGVSVFDPFMGSGTTIGEAHKLGLTAFGRDINPVAVQSVVSAMGPMDRTLLDRAYKRLDAGVGARIRELYETKDDAGVDATVLYHFWVMQVDCLNCSAAVDLFSSYVFAANAYPKRRPEVQVVCPGCCGVFEGLHGRTSETCSQCGLIFNPYAGPAKGQNAVCNTCQRGFSILDAVGKRGSRPDFRLYAKLVLNADGTKRYLRATTADENDYAKASDLLRREVAAGHIALPALALEAGYNTRQAMRYGFTNWRDFFNDRQLLALGWLRSAVGEIEDPSTRAVMLTLSSGLLEFNNVFASYKGEGTGAVRHMFSHHILKPERTPIEANVWGTPKSSGSFSGLYKTRLGRALTYRQAPTEVKGGNGEKAIVASPAFSGTVLPWPSSEPFARRGIYFSCGDSSVSGLPDGSMDLVITDPPFFDNVHYSELADFFYAWAQIGSVQAAVSTRNEAEVQDTDADSFGKKLRAVFRECHRVLKEDGLLAFTYHHSREEGWHPLAAAVLGAGFVVVASQPVKAEMSVATPVAAAKDPINFDIVIVCRKVSPRVTEKSRSEAMLAAKQQIARLDAGGFKLSRGDRRVIEFGQLLTTVTSSEDALYLADNSEAAIEQVDAAIPA